MRAEGLLAEFVQGLGVAGEELPAVSEAFSGLTGAAFGEGRLSRKVKELIGVACAVMTRCQHCIVYHAKAALDAGAAREEILEAAAVGVVFGGAPAMVHLSVTLMDALDALEK